VEEDGSFAFADVPEGSYRAVLWSRDATLRGERAVVVPASGTVAVDLR
jgi:hypothetical protein